MFSVRKTMSCITTGFLPFEHCIRGELSVIHFRDLFPINLDVGLFAAFLMGLAFSTLLRL
jgi:hypothetical protein